MSSWFNKYDSGQWSGAPFHEVNIGLDPREHFFTNFLGNGAQARVIRSGRVNRPA